jgi:hypothetical protein
VALSFVVRFRAGSGLNWGILQAYLKVSLKSLCSIQKFSNQKILGLGTAVLMCMEHGTWSDKSLVKVFANVPGNSRDHAW